MEFYSKKRSIGCFDKYIIMISEILSQISEIEYLKINFSFHQLNPKYL